MTKFKAFADHKLNVTKMTISPCDQVENTVGKKENAGYQHLLRLPTVFSKAFFFRIIKSRDCVVKLTSSYATSNLITEHFFFFHKVFLSCLPSGCI